MIHEYEAEGNQVCPRRQFAFNGLCLIGQYLLDDAIRLAVFNMEFYAIMENLRAVKRCSRRVYALDANISVLTLIWLPESRVFRAFGG